MLLTITSEELAEAIAALHHLESTGTAYPKGYGMQFECPLPEAYKTMAGITGYLK